MVAVEKFFEVSVEDYLAEESARQNKHEYLGGVVYAMAGATVRHNKVASNFHGHLYGVLRGHPCQPFNSDMMVRIEMAQHTRFYYPDGMVVCDSNADNAIFQDRPVVILEVLSEGTRRVDQSEKRDGYQAIPSLKVLLLAESDEPSVTIYRRAATGGFARERVSGMDATISLPEIDAALPLVNLYERVEFEEADETA